jgi:hypothetical protein
MSSKSPSQYTQDEVNMWLLSIGLGSKIDVFKNNAIDGTILVTLTEDDLTGASLQLTTLQARKFQTSLKFATNIVNNCSFEQQQQRIRSLEISNEQLQKENCDLKALLKALQEPCYANNNYQQRKNKTTNYPPPTSPIPSTHNSIAPTTCYGTTIGASSSPTIPTVTTTPYTTTPYTTTPYTATATTASCGGSPPYCDPYSQPTKQGGTGTFRNLTKMILVIPDDYSFWKS